MKTIGILGGLGPSTTSKLYLDLVNSKEFEEYPNILISNVCFTKGIDKKIIQGKRDIGIMLIPLLNSINQLKKAQADFIVLPCNTLEGLVPTIIARSNVRLLTPVKETCKELKKLHPKKIGLIATSKTRELRLYEKELPKVSVAYPSIKDQSTVSSIINRIIINKSEKGDKSFLKDLIKQLKKEGCEKVILGCTDLSHLIKEDGFVVDSFSVLSRKIEVLLKKDEII